jgi:hypothetical protein
MKKILLASAFVFAAAAPALATGVNGTSSSNPPPQTYSGNASGNPANAPMMQSGASAGTAGSKVNNTSSSNPPPQQFNGPDEHNGNGSAQ